MPRQKKGEGPRRELVDLSDETTRQEAAERIARGYDDIASWEVKGLLDSWEHELGGMGGGNWDSYKALKQLAISLDNDVTPTEKIRKKLLKKLPQKNPEMAYNLRNGCNSGDVFEIIKCLDQAIAEPSRDAELRRRAAELIRKKCVADKADNRIEKYGVDKAKAGRGTQVLPDEVWFVIEATHVYRRAYRGRSLDVRAFYMNVYPHRPYGDYACFVDDVLREVGILDKTYIVLEELERWGELDSDEERRERHREGLRNYTGLSEAELRERV